MKSTIEFMLISFIVLALILVLGIVGVSLAMIFMGKPLPQDLSAWSNMGLGFIFGIVATLMKDWSTFALEKEK